MWYHMIYYHHNDQQYHHLRYREDDVVVMIIPPRCWMYHPHSAVAGCVYIYICVLGTTDRRHFTNVCVCFWYENIIGLLMKKIENTIYYIYNGVVV